MPALEVRDVRGEWRPAAEAARARPRRQVGWADGVGAGAAAHRRMVEGAAAVCLYGGGPSRGGLAGDFLVDVRGV